MLISLNYAIFGLALLLSLDLFRRPPAYREAATHLMLFALAALFGGFAHHMEMHETDIIRWIANTNATMPEYFKVSSFNYVYIRVWLGTFLLIGLTEYYFMRIFLHPLADQYQLHWIKIALLTSLCLFSLATFLFGEYSLVVLYHLMTHLLVIGFSLYLIFQKGMKAFWQLIALATLNLIAGGIWSLMAVGEMPTGPLHYNDWYHIIILVFVVYLHWTMTRGGLVMALTHLRTDKACTISNSKNPH